MKIFALALLPLFLCHCAPSSQFLDPDYQGKDFSGQSLNFFAPDSTQLKIVSMADFDDDFEEVRDHKESFLAQLTGEEIVSGFKAGARQIQIMGDSLPRALPDSGTRLFTQRVGEKPIEVRISLKEFLDSNGMKSRFALILGTVSFERKTSSGPGWSLVAPVASVGPVSLNASKSGGGGGKSLTATLQYVIFDYVENKPVAYGQVNGVATFNFAMTRADWYEAAKDAARKILEKSPFK